jgi:hypothetical protein
MLILKIRWIFLKISMTYSFKNIFERKCLEYLEFSKDETKIKSWLENYREPFSLILAEGFEERSLGILASLLKYNVKPKKIILGRYSSNYEGNKKYRKRFEDLGNKLNSQNFSITNIGDDNWIQDAVKSIDTEDILFDISGISNSSLFYCLDEIFKFRRKIFVGYSDAIDYWPKKDDWEELRKSFDDFSTLSDTVNKKPWLFSSEHNVHLVQNHEGYEGAGKGRALISFLPFKGARLSAILGEEDYAELLFIAVMPYLKVNSWRCQALLEINSPIIKNWPVVKINAFGYRDTIKDLLKILFIGESLFEKFDVHLAILGSKLQNIGCWVLSSIIKSITVVTSNPSEYYPEAFSEGIGRSWIIELKSPNIKKE